MKDKNKFGFDENETYYDLNRKREITGWEANTLLKACPNKDLEAFVLLSIIPMRLKKTKK